MKKKLQDKIWIRDKSECRQCGKRLLGVVETSQTYLKRLLEMKEIPVYKWNTKCWNCDETIPLVSYSFEFCFDFDIGSIKKLDDILTEKYKFVRYSPKFGIVMNFCSYCRNPFGKSYVSKELTEMLIDGVDMNRLVDLRIPNIFSLEDLLPKEALKHHVEREDGVIHHIDGNPENNKLNNLILLCRSCHGKIGLGSGYYQKEREKGRVRKERKWSEKWRKNYYSQKKNTDRDLHPDQSMLSD